MAADRGYRLSAELNNLAIQTPEFVTDLIVFEACKAAELRNIPKCLSNNRAIRAVGIGGWYLAGRNLLRLDKFHEVAEPQFLSFFATCDVKGPGNEQVNVFRG